MPKKEFKKKIAKLLNYSFKSSPTCDEKITIDNPTIESQNEDLTIEKKKEDPIVQIMTTIVHKTSNDIALHSKKRDVIIIGAGLSGK